MQLHCPSLPVRLGARPLCRAPPPRLVVAAARRTGIRCSAAAAAAALPLPPQQQQYQEQQHVTPTGSAFHMPPMAELASHRPVGVGTLPQPPAESTLFQVVPYLVKLALDEKQLKQRLGISVMFMIISRVASESMATAAESFDAGDTGGETPGGFGAVRRWRASSLRWGPRVMWVQLCCRQGWATGPVVASEVTGGGRGFRWVPVG